MELGRLEPPEPMGLPERQEFQLLAPPGRLERQAQLGLRELLQVFLPSVQAF